MPTVVAQPRAEIIVNPLWSSSQASQYWAKLDKEAQQGWLDCFKRSPVSALQLLENESLLHQNDPALRERAAAFKKCTDRMEKCCLKAPCKVIGCKRCSRLVVHNSATEVAAISRSYSASRRGRVVCCSLKSNMWFGTARRSAERVRRDMAILQTILNDFAELDGYRFTLDAAPMAKQKEAWNDKSIAGAGKTRFDIHLHGTLLLVSGHLEKFKGRLMARLEEAGLEIDIWTEYAESSYRNGNGSKRATVCTFADVARWSCYTEKLQTGGKLSAAHQHLLQRELYDLPRAWSGGRLARKIDTETVVNTNTLRQEIDSLEQFQREHDLFDQFHEQIGELRELTDQLTTSQYQATEARRKRTARRIAAYRRLRALYNPTKLASEWEAWKAESRRRRDCKQSTHYRQLRIKLERLLFRVVKATTKAMSVRTGRAATAIRKFADKTELTPETGCVSMVSICSNIISIRRRMRDHALTAGAVIGRSSLLSGAVQLQSQLRSLDAFWPAIGHDESCTKLRWATFWKRWRHLLFASL